MILLKIQDILRRSGGMDIKLKGRILFLLKIIMGIYGILIVCYGIFYLVDTFGNGLFLDWFAST